jgi:hypothetical protein
MAIRVECECGKTFQVADEQEGRKVRCPACQDLVAVPGEPDEVRTYYLEKKTFCPKCRREWPDGTELCVNCGHDFRTGKKVKPRYDPEVRELVQTGVVWLGCWRLFAERTAGGKLLLFERQWLFGIPLWKRACCNLTKCDRLIVVFFGVAYDTREYESVAIYAEGPRQKRILVTSGQWNPPIVDAIIQHLKEMALFEVVVEHKVQGA